MPRDLLEDSQPVDLLEGQDLLSNQPNEPQGFTGFLGEKQAQTENLIAQRPSMMKSMVQDPATLARFRQHPLGTSLRAAGGALELLEGIPSSVALALQRGRPQEIPQDVMSTITGNRPAQRGDITRAIGVPEPISAGIGLLSGASLIMPETAGTNALASGVSKITQLPQLMNKFGKPILAKVMSVFSQVPEESMNKALSNPNFLKKGWLAKEGIRVKDSYKKVIQPLIDDSSKKVDVSSMKTIAEDLGMISKDGEWTKQVTSLKPGEVRKLLKWENDLQKGTMSFNKVDSLMGEMDSALQPLYKSKEQGKVIAYSDKFKRLTVNFRGELNKLRKAQYPEAGKVLNEYETFKAGETVYRNFDRWFPHLIPAIVGSAGMGALGMSGQGAYSPLILGAIPKLQSYGIRTAAQVGGNLAKTGAMLPEAAFEQWRNNQTGE